MSTPSALPVNAGDPQQNDSVPATTTAENAKTATTTAAAVPETPAQSADKPQAQPQQPKQAIDDDDDDDESDLDELDDVLDDFNKPKPAPAPAPSAPSQPATAPEAEDFDEETFMKMLEKDMASMMNHAAKESGTSDDKGFEDTINQGADAFTKQLEESGIPPGDFIKQLLADVMAEEESGGDATAGAAAAPSTGSAGSSSGGAGAGAPPESFNDAIQQTINRMQESGDKATAAASEANSDDMLAKMIKAIAAGADIGEEDGGFMNMVAAMMEQLSNKEMLYEPMKELNGKFGPWLVENKGKGKFSDEEMERFEKQATLASQIVAKFEEPGYTDEDPKCRDYVWQKMQEMQAAGSPPEELVANPFSDDNVGPAGMPDCPQQ
ncbi:Pex19 protein family-domain-containing protein [Aspergillus caelatus]|uniref:Pex19 protein family-domain-containing protein n=1 Tax=Aspergillus caelatus TaxID=61420 RepID=A0A5N6ZV10_9EURO|nr:Pex19 protein family-domain-containing protein [Aspergillus caelatus]KAE8361407.1 Pex19 protein family-domain-containing protein [Aspergillus caelatus]